MSEYTITWEELLRHLNSVGVRSQTEICFGAGNLEFHRVKRRGDNLVQIEFNQQTWPLPNERDNTEYERRRKQ
jgi:hypothetical protein